MMRTLLVGLGSLGERVVARIRDLAVEEVAPESRDRKQEISVLAINIVGQWSDALSRKGKNLGFGESIALPLDEAQAVVNESSLLREVPWLSQARDLASTTEIYPRQLGRLALWIRSLQVGEALKFSIDRLLSGGFSPEGSFRSVLICSLEDAWESGIIADLSDSLRRFKSSRQRIVFLILPERGCMGSPDDQANTFGVLREICNLEASFPIEPLERQLLSEGNGPLWHSVYVLKPVENEEDRLSASTEHVAQSILAGIGSWNREGRRGGLTLGMEAEVDIGTCEGFFLESHKSQAGPFRREGRDASLEKKLSEEVLDLGLRARKMCDDLFEVYLGRTITEASQLLISEIKDRIRIIKDSIGESKTSKAIELSESIKRLHDIAKIRAFQGQLVLIFDRRLLVQRSSWFDADVLIRRDALDLLQELEKDGRLSLDACRSYWAMGCERGKQSPAEDVGVEGGGPSLEDLLVNGRRLWKDWRSFVEGEGDDSEEESRGEVDAHSSSPPGQQTSVKSKRILARLRDLHENLEFRCGLLLETLDTRVFRESLKNELSLRAKEILIDEIEKAQRVTPPPTMKQESPGGEQGEAGSGARSLWDSLAERISVRRPSPFLPISISSQGRGFVFVRVPEDADLEDQRLVELIRATFGGVCDIARYPGRRLWVYYEESSRSPCDLRDLAAYREAYRQGPLEMRHIDRRYVGHPCFKDPCSKLIGSVILCGNSACSADISGYSPTRRECPECRRWILSRCGNPECSLDNLHTHPDRLALSCPACGGLNQAAWWVCSEHGKNGVLVSVEKERCPACIHAHHEDGIRFPAERISHRPGFPRSIPCPRCLDLKAEKPFMIPEKLIPFFRDGVNGHDRALFDELARTHKLGDGGLCPRCRTYLIPVHHQKWRPSEGTADVPRNPPSPAEEVAEPEKPSEESASSEMSTSSLTGPPPSEPPFPEGLRSPGEVTE